MRRLGISVDWSREKFTMDPDLSDAVQKTFFSLYKDGLIYRAKDWLTGILIFVRPFQI